MAKFYNCAFVVLSLVAMSCQKKHNKNDFSAYFAGEITNPTSRFVIFCKNSIAIDTIPLKNNNTFAIKFDSLTPGLYSFKHEPEYQYVYFEKNDSLMVTINANNFDQSVVFSGRGEEKNNFLMELYLKNEADRSTLFSVLDYSFDKFTKHIDSAYQSKKEFYDQNKEKINWSKEFDWYAQARLNFFHLSKKEIYPVAHKFRTGEDIRSKLPKDYYNFRSEIDFNNEKLTNYSPFVKYLTHMLNNITMTKTNVEENEINTSLALNIEKLNVADTLFNNQRIKNTILNNIAFSYLLEDQNISNVQLFLNRFNQISTDKPNRNDIIKMGEAIQTLKAGNALPGIDVMDKNNKLVHINSILNKKSVIFFWTDRLDSHMVAAHKKVIELEKKHQDYQFIAINVDNSQAKWVSDMKNSHFKNVREFRCTDFEDLKQKWVINKIHRTIITDEKGKIDNAFVSLFDVNFEKLLH